MSNALLGNVPLWAKASGHHSAFTCFTSPFTNVKPELPSAWPVGHSAKTNPASTINELGAKGTESIGSRLRKRRRADSSPTDDTSPAPKRTQSKNATVSSGKHQQAASSPQAASSTSKMKPELSQQANPPFAEGSNQDDFLVMQLEQANTSETTRPKAATNMRPQSGEESDVTAGKSNHGETVDSRQDSHIYDVTDIVDTESFHRVGASFHLKTQSLPILDNLVSL